VKQVRAFLQSMAPYSPSRQYELDYPKLPKENPRDYEKRTWMERCHYRTDGHIFIPPMAFASSLKEAAKYLSIQIPGKGKATYTKHFEAGVIVGEGLTLIETRETVKGEWLSLSPRGIKHEMGVWKCMPKIDKWSGVIQYDVLDETITADIFKQVIFVSGQFMGIGRFRPSNGGIYGRFKVNKIEWEDIQIA
jgi:hypothetical protein